MRTGTHSGLVPPPASAGNFLGNESDGRTIFLTKIKPGAAHLVLQTTAATPTSNSRFDSCIPHQLSRSQVPNPLGPFAGRPGSSLLPGLFLPLDSRSPGD